MIKRTYLFGLISLLLAFSSSRPVDASCVPMLPSELLPLLPDGKALGKDWKLVESRGANSYEKGWLVTNISRTFKKISVNGNGTTIPIVLRIRVIDCGGFPGWSEIFTNFQIGTSAKQQKLLIGSSPAIETLENSNVSLIKLQIQSRFICYIAAHGSGNDSEMELLVAKLLTSGGLIGVSGAQVASPPRPYIAETVDEIHPERNTRLMQTYVTDAEYTNNLELIRQTENSARLVGGPPPKVPSGYPTHNN